MQLDSLTIETRVRSGWSAIDLGTVLARDIWVRSVILWIIVAAPIYLLCRVFGGHISWLAPLVLWWCKPLMERPILYLLSRELFSQKMSVAMVVRDIKHWLLPRLLAIISYRRISFARSMYAPILLLERPEFGEYSKRATTLGAKYSGEGTWLTVVLFHFENFFGLGLLILLSILIPDMVDFAKIFEELEFSADAQLVTMLAMAMVAPFYVASGFMLYISRRIELEGWDIEICLRDWMRDVSAHEYTQSPTRPDSPEKGRQAA